MKINEMHSRLGCLPQRHLHKSYIGELKDQIVNLNLGFIECIYFSFVFCI